MIPTFFNYVLIDNCEIARRSVKTTYAVLFLKKYKLPWKKNCFVFIFRCIKRFGEFRGMSTKFPEVRGWGGDIFWKSPNFGDGAGTEFYCKMRTGRGEDSKIATGNFEVCPRISPEVRGRGGDKIFEEKLHPSLEVSSPKPLDQSKNVTVRSYYKLSKDQNGPKNHQKIAKIAKLAKNTNRSTAPCSFIKLPLHKIVIFHFIQT